ncbi:MAG: peptidylprolyl isomerase, partial [Chloroflexi bacterium]|nr:peptidylprolyl isomerase [Chloroflexota bacterium]
NGKHSVFGKVTKGMDVLAKLTPRDPNTNPPFQGDKVLRIDIKETQP